MLIIVANISSMQSTLSTGSGARQRVSAFRHKCLPAVRLIVVNAQSLLHTTTNYLPVLTDY